MHHLVESEEAMRQLASDFASQLKVGDLVSLEGDLGVGKTFFAKSCLSALGVSGTITSPTFPIANIYNASENMMIHCDLYRLDSLKEFENVGVFELFPNSISLIEWGDKFLDGFEFTHRIRFSFVNDGLHRLVEIQ